MNNNLTEKDSTCYMIKIEFNNSVIHDFLASEPPFVNGQCMSFHGYQGQKDKFYYIMLNNVNYFTTIPIHKEGE